MKIDKAIELLALIDYPDEWEMDSDDIDAIKLGIEALKRIKEQTYPYYQKWYKPLPGETQ